MGKNHPLVPGSESQLGPSAYYCNTQFPNLIQATQSSLSLKPWPTAESSVQQHRHTYRLKAFRFIWKPSGVSWSPQCLPHPKPGLDLEAEKVFECKYSLEGTFRRPWPVWPANAIQTSTSVFYREHGIS